ncbi:hypothetical protein SAMN02745857_02163 [Andreprevotia lacus DSM 23236]|jgi:hypothetical protein|uniref:VCBS repeat-containing protein n=1 Tax=Andreprevotia lacus DSM 23236 TaxID=1121001 RepID=A0A1W1XNH8_9NEIS|nr:hypothetical protein [Andreprevotia lacus]SMC25427.1 hypothetical protein SAMN02745857_02163 [Andreprevotia lacus DSM 23236]
MWYAYLYKKLKRNLLSMLLAGFAVCANPVLAGPAPALLAQAKAAFEHYAPGAHFHEDATAFGDINGDGITDFATFLGDPNYNDHGVEDVKVLVFLGAKDHTFSLLEASRALPGHERIFYVVDIKRQSVFVHSDGSGGCCSHWGMELQFRQQASRLMLIGLESVNVYVDGSDEQESGTSANLLTGKVIDWSGSGKARREKKRVLTGLKPVSFAEFDYRHLPVE